MSDDRVGGRAAMPRAFRMMSIVGAMIPSTESEDAKRVTWGCAEVAKSQGMKRSTHLRGILYELYRAGVVGFVLKTHPNGKVRYSYRFYLKDNAVRRLARYVRREYPAYLDPET